MTYPVLLLRFKAMMLDSIVLGVLFFGMVALSSAIGITDTLSRLCFIFVPVVLYEPLMIWITGGSLGHHVSGIRVVGKNSNKNLFVLNGVIRFIAKTLFGVFSLASMFISKRHQSLHDFLSHSVVVFKDEATAPASYKLTPRDNDYTIQKPSVGRRFVVIIAWLAITLVAIYLPIIVLVSNRCIEFGRCSEAETFKMAVFGIALIIAAIVIILLGIFCMIPGAFYRAPKKN